MRLREHRLLIPRGGPSLIRSILENATVPYVIDGDGNCHVYVDASADLDMAAGIVVNAKTQRPSVCNAAETLLVHEAVASVPAGVAPELEGVELVGDDGGLARSRWAAATDDDWATEFLDLKLAVGVVDSLDDAIDHVSRYGSGHTEAIVTARPGGRRPVHPEVDAAAVSSTRRPGSSTARSSGSAPRSASAPEAPRPGPHGPPRADDDQVRGARDGQIRG